MPKSPKINIDLPVSLEKIAKGGTEKTEYQRKIILKNGKEKFENEIFKIDIKAGTTDGTPIILHKKGDQIAGMPPSDIIYTVRFAQHQLFKASGVNLEYTHLIDLKETKYGTKIKIPTLYGPYFLPFTNDRDHEIFNYGLPHKKDTRKRGKLIVHFKVEKNNDGFVTKILKKIF